eukprot:TRINITY_DN7805_c0_g1_i1.p1 TRINITY_DN7805_c0_g1~~TRINITY_DN7805_c0_g1_i1.p1  ORF type:complete len:501 (-),score=111.56 TRINITY_DN7805_c0_g1_i1:185-1645(-)
MARAHGRPIIAAALSTALALALLLRLNALGDTTAFLAPQATAAADVSLHGADRLLFVSSSSFASRRGVALAASSSGETPKRTEDFEAAGSSAYRCLAAALLSGAAACALRSSARTRQAASRRFRSGWSRVAPGALCGRTAPGAGADARALALTALSAGGPVAGIEIAGTGSFAPEAAVSNDDLAQIIDTSDEWITQRTGIRRRHVLTPSESLGGMALEAAKRALEASNAKAEELELIILATSTPDDLFGSATSVAAGLGATRAVAFDLTAACSGFAFALVTAAQYVRSGAYKSVLVIGADCLSRWVDWSDRGTCVLFGDGAGAVVLRATSPERDALLGFELGSDGSGRANLACSEVPEAVALGGGQRGAKGSYSPLAMNGNEVFRFATSVVPRVLNTLLTRHQIPTEKIDWLLLHQANRRIMESAAKRFKLPQDKILCNLDEYGNTSAGSIPLALDEEDLGLGVTAAAAAPPSLAMAFNRRYAMAA